jgi:tripartite-type tricarboxylate transporter receptor subunit TctC
MVYFEQATGTKLQYVPYRGAAPAMQDLVAQHVDLTCLEAGQSLANYRAGMFKVYAMMGNRHFSLTPEVPTIDEAGLPGLRFPFWHALWAPKGTPKPVTTRLNAAVKGAFADPAVQKRFADLGMEIPPPDLQTPEGLRTMHRAELDKWWPMMKAAGMKMQ